MGKIKNIVQILNKYSDFTVLLIIFFTSFYMMKDSILFFDDIFSHFIPGGIRFYKNFYYGTWVMELQNIIFYYIPYKLGINLQDWALHTAGIIKSIIITGLMHCYIKVIKLHYKGKIIRYCLVFIMYYLFLKYISNIQFGEFVIMEAFLRFILPSLLICLFIYKFYEFIVFKTPVSFVLYFLAFICAASSEIIAVISVTLTAFTLLHSIIEKREKQNLKHQAFILLTLILGACLMMCSKGFQAHFLDKQAGIVISLSSLLNSFPEYISLFCKKLIYEFKIYYLILFIFMFLQFKKVPKLRLFFPIYIIFGCFAFCLSLIIMGKTSYINDYWLKHADIYTPIAILMQFVILLSICNYLAFVKNKIKEKIILTVILAVLMISVKPLIITVKTIASTLTNTRNYVYLRDKIRLFYAYRNEIPVMPIITCVTFTYTPATNINVVDTDTYIPHFGADKTSDLNMTYYEKMQYYYYPVVFNKPKEMFKNENIIEDSLIAIQKFKSSGGSTDEIKQNKIIFAKLSDEKFVLNEK